MSVWVCNDCKFVMAPEYFGNCTQCGGQATRVTSYRSQTGPYPTPHTDKGPDFVHNDNPDCNCFKEEK